MNGIISNGSPLRRLLSSWKCHVIVEHVENEGIDIEELEMMKIEHVIELLRNYRLGIRIRFEHNFEKWRRGINKPVANMGSNNINVPIFGSTFNDMQPNNENNQTYNNKCVSIGVNTDAVEMNVLSIKTPPPSLLTLPPAIKVIPQINEIRVQKDVPQISQAVSIESFSSTYSHTAIDNSETTLLLNILKSSGPRGLGILKYYDENRILTDAHRTTLIQLIVEYFKRTNQHLSLPTTYDLEQQILKLFSTEKLRHYRTSKRGKIYIKYFNIKSTKREKDKNNKMDSSEHFVNLIESDHDKSNKTMITSDTAQNSESSYEPTELLEFEIKTEKEMFDMDVV
ncbi:uncharacterized protein LOC119684216 isoform X1 [Teleopsis dalmanni]|uniref:uncharacterized protein LOC119684216 isoform X1 n=1 Tax=Teleopsis dalmanni TaxID=139649 RepID=UPI0018CE271C|nr:uncharacterized protein LOC119684216 isoform X1 [Teleopsis dalmanni]